MLLLLIGIYVSMEFRSIFDKGTPERDLMKLAHFTMGICLLFLVVPRLLARLFTSTPPITPSLPKYMHLLSKLMHLSLYALMIVMPLIGWTMINANGREVIWLGIHLPTFIVENKPLARQLHEIHEIGATIGYFLIGAHTLAALFHHYYLKNNVLLRMTFLKR